MRPTPAAVLGSLCLAAAAALAACASTKTPAAAGSAPATAQETADADRDFYEARCGVCHVPFHRNEYAPEEWPGIVEVMAPRAGLSAAQRVRVLRWLQAR